MALAQRSGEASGGDGGAALDLHEGIVPPDRIADPATGCKRWPEHLRLVNEQTGEVVVGRCRATNLCRYCQQLYVLETVEMLTLDALEHAPTLWVVLTAREHLTRAECRRHLDKLRQWARRQWPAIEWFVQVEFQRRGALHLNLLVKGVPVEDQAALHELLSTRWCERVDAEPVGQWIGPVADAGGVVRYLQKTLSHGLKQEQAPPLGWRGHRTSQTRGYLVRPAGAMRQEAREALRLKREVWRAQRAGHDAHDVELVAHQAVERGRATSWRLRSLDLRMDDDRRSAPQAPAAEGAQRPVSVALPAVAAPGGAAPSSAQLGLRAASTAPPPSVLGVPPDPPLACVSSSASRLSARATA
jgi:hypothetical protein